MSPMRFLAIIDPPALLRPQSDTSVAFLDEMRRRGHEVAVCQMHELWLREGEAAATVTWVEAVSRTTAPALTLRAGTEPQPLSHFGAVLMRKDPPYDGTYHLCTQILE